MMYKQVSFSSKNEVKEITSNRITIIDEYERDIERRYWINYGNLINSISGRCILCRHVICDDCCLIIRDGYPICNKCIADKSAHKNDCYELSCWCKCKCKEEVVLPAPISAEDKCCCVIL